MNVIEAKSLSKTYQRPFKEAGLKGSLKSLLHRTVLEKKALSDFDLTVGEGELVGLIGPNGAGKTTLVKMLCGIIQPTSGSLSVIGYRPGDLNDDFRRQYAVVMGQKSQLWWDLPSLDTFLLNKEIYGIPKERFKKNLDGYADLFGVSELLQVPVRNLSLGERMKMELMAALLHDPVLIFLDEPTIGLDAIAQKQIRQFLKEVNSLRKVTVLLTSHYMEDIRHLCRRTIVINEGSKMYDGPLDELLARFQGQRDVQVTLSDPVGMDVELPNTVEWTDRQPYRLQFRVDRAEVRNLLASLLSQCEIEDIRIEDEEIGNVIERIYRSGKEVFA
jgi:ABC-2 type transport system ATP-binding protein